MKAKLVAESLNERFDYNKEKYDDLYHISDLERIEQQLKSEGFDIELYFEETHAGIDHYAITDRNNSNSLAWMPKGYMASISDSDDWGWIVFDNMQGDLQGFEEDEEAAVEAFIRAL